MSDTNHTQGRETPDYVAMAKKIQAERQCSFREASMIVKRRHPEARAAFIKQHDTPEVHRALASQT